MERVPVEIWTPIFTLACTDDGTTGRSLSQVSQYIRTVSRPIRFQSVAVKGWDQLQGLANSLESVSTECRRVRHLCISVEDPPPKELSLQALRSLTLEELAEVFALRQFPPEYELQISRVLQSAGSEWARKPGQFMAERRGTLRENLTRILQIVSPHIRSLTLYADAASPDILNNLQFPLLTELTLRGRFWQESRVKVLPSLRYLHLVDCPSFLEAFLDRVPAMTHLRLTGVTYFSHRLHTVFVKTLFPTTTGDDEVERIVPTELSNVKRILLQAHEYILDLYDGTRPLLSRLATSERVVVSLQSSDEQELYGYLEAKKDWLGRIDGDGEGCWILTPSSVDLHV